MGICHLRVHPGEHIPVVEIRDGCVQKGLEEVFRWQVGRIDFEFAHEPAGAVLRLEFILDILDILPGGQCDRYVGLPPCVLSMTSARALRWTRMVSPRHFGFPGSRRFGKTADGGVIVPGAVDVFLDVKPAQQNVFRICLISRTW